MELFQQTSPSNSTRNVEGSPSNDVFAALAIPNLKNVTQTTAASSLDLSQLVAPSSLRDIANGFLFEQELQRDFRALSFSPHSYLRQSQAKETFELAA